MNCSWSFIVITKSTDSITIMSCENTGHLKKILMKKVKEDTKRMGEKQKSLINIVCFGFY